MEIMAAEPGVWRQYREHPESFRFPGGESLAEQQRRVLAALRDIAQGGRDALLGTHGGSIRLVRCLLDGRGIAAFHDMTLANCEVEEVLSDGLIPRIERFLT